MLYQQQHQVVPGHKVVLVPRGALFYSCSSTESGEEVLVR